MAFVKFVLVAALAAVCLQEINGHGMMVDPVSRSSAWRQGFDTPKNYNDNELFCGGYGIHHGVNKGMCGVCGDSYSLAQPRPNENGGLYGTGTIVRKYKKGETIKVTVRLSANHFGTFQFALCPLNNPTDLETEECFNNHPLYLADGSDRYTLHTNEKRDFNVDVVLPSDITCKQCVMRWHYRTANTWGKCEDGTTGLGCGNQETFRNCADISIQS